MATEPATVPRLRKGKTLDQRKSERREQLVQAALDLIGEQGAAAVTVRALCRNTGLTARYFYESFDGRDELIVTLFTEVAGEVHSILTAALGDTNGSANAARAMVGTFVDAMMADPRKARLLLVEPLAEKALSGVSVAQVPAFTRAIRDQLPETAGRTERSLTALGLAGALGAILSSWISGSLRADRDAIVDHCAHLLTRAG